MKRKQASNRKADIPTPGEEADKSERLRRRILDATLACYVEYGWSGTNMSVIARHVGMTRGMIQYYFPTLEDVLQASISHLNNEWQKKYYSYVREESGKADRLEVGIMALWRLMQDPLHVAKQELMAAARSDAALREVMRKEAAFDEASTLEQAKLTYPDLARQDEAVFRRALDFTVIFLEGLSRHPFSDQAAARSQALLDMLKDYLAAYWREHGIDMAKPRGAVKARAAESREDLPQPPPGLSERERDHALALILKAASILSPPKDDPDFA